MSDLEEGKKEDENEKKEVEEGKGEETDKGGENEKGGEEEKKEGLREAMLGEIVRMEKEIESRFEARKRLSGSKKQERKILAEEIKELEDERGFTAERLESLMRADELRLKMMVIEERRVDAEREEEEDRRVREVKRKERREEAEEEEEEEKRMREEKRQERREEREKEKIRREMKEEEDEEDNGEGEGGDEEEEVVKKKEGGKRREGRAEKLPAVVPEMEWREEGTVMGVVVFLSSFESAMFQEGLEEREWGRALVKSAQKKPEVREELVEELGGVRKWEEMKVVVLKVVIGEDWEREVEKAFEGMRQGNLRAKEYRRRIEWVGRLCGVSGEKMKEKFCEGLAEKAKRSVRWKWAEKKKRVSRTWTELVRQAQVEEGVGEGRRWEVQGRGAAEGRREQGGGGGGVAGSGGGVAGGMSGGSGGGRDIKMRYVGGSSLGQGVLGGAPVSSDLARDEKCFKCGEWGHVSRSCKAVYPEGEGPWCFKCRKRGHRATECAGLRVMFCGDCGVVGQRLHARRQAGSTNFRGCFLESKER
jgi:hypothetical protein